MKRQQFDCRPPSDVSKKKKMKLPIKLIALITIISALLVSCEPDEITAPAIQNVEIGSNNSKTAYIGGDLHLEAEIIAPGKIAGIRVLIHQEEEGEEAPAQNVNSSIEHSDEWVLDSVYTGVYANVKNTTFHEHVDVPSNAVAGVYHLHLYVTDLEGNQTMIEEEITIMAPGLSVTTISTTPVSDQDFSYGNRWRRRIFGTLSGNNQFVS